VSVVSLIATVRRNTPRRKPQFWGNPAFALQRRLAYQLMSRLDPGWADRPHVVPLRELGLRMEVVPHLAIDSAIFTYGMWELPGTQFVKAILRPGMVFLDVGAATGYYSMLAARLVGARGAVHSFEPVEDLRLRLERNARLNKLSNISVHPEAVARAAGMVDFYDRAERANYGTSSVLPNHTSAEASRTVRATRMDDFAATLPGGRLDLVKIDVEGAEADVLEGADVVLSSPAPPVLLFESFDVAGPTHFLQKRGYTVAALSYSLAEGLIFAEAGSDFNNVFDRYEAPNYVALREGEAGLSFAALSRASRDAASRLVRLIGRVG
jgi:FkbM family methyltransferase